MTHLAKFHAGTDPPREVGRRIPPVGIVTADAGKLPVRGAGIDRAFERMSLAREAAHHMAGGVDLRMAA